MPQDAVTAPQTATPAAARDLSEALNDLAQHAAVSADRAALAAAVLRLEQAAGAPLGGADLDPPVVLRRRVGRAHRLLARGSGHPPVELTLTDLRLLIAALGGGRD